MTTVNLSNVVAAAHIDPSAPQGKTSHSSDVTPVQQALVRKGFLDGHDTSWGRGCYGTLTVAAYARYQQSLGYSGPDADGVPGFASLTKLGQDTSLFVVVVGSTPIPTPPAPHGHVPISVGSVTYGNVGDASMSKTLMPAVFKIMGITDAGAQANWTTGCLTAASRESSYDLNAINNYDLNAHGPIQSDGYPLYCSRGLMQCIPPTFAHYHEAGTSNDIYDGVANICASMNYVMAVYGVSRHGSNLASNVQQFDPNRAPRGY
jgi:hypothetical protein